MEGVVQQLQQWAEVAQSQSLHTQLTWVMIVSGAATFAALFLIDAPYGRYTRGGWGPLLNANVAWLTQEIPSLLVTAAFCIRAGPASFLQNPTSLRTLTTGIFMAHYFYRSLIYPFRIKGRNDMPLSVWAMSITFCIWNGYLQGVFLGDQLSPTARVTPRAAVGLAIQLFGLLNVILADHILVSLRKPGETGYKIPRGGAFTLVSAGNYLSEMTEWTGYALATGGLAPAAFAWFTFCNLAPRGWKHHLWYLSKFEDYPKSRRAIIPFIW